MPKCLSYDRGFSTLEEENNGGGGRTVHVMYENKMTYSTAYVVCILVKHICNSCGKQIKSQMSHKHRAYKKRENFLKRLDLLNESRLACASRHKPNVHVIFIVKTSMSIARSDLSLKI